MTLYPDIELEQQHKSIWYHCSTRGGGGFWDSNKNIQFCDWLFENQLDSLVQFSLPWTFFVSNSSPNTISRGLTNEFCCLKYRSSWYCVSIFVNLKFFLALNNSLKVWPAETLGTSCSISLRAKLTALRRSSATFAVEFTKLNACVYVVFGLSN